MRPQSPREVELALMASPHTAQLAGAVQALTEASIEANASAVEDALTAIEQRIMDIEPRRGVPVTQSVAVFQRDCWTCRYCGGQTIAPPVLRVLSRMYPDRFPFHPNWKAGQVHPAYLLLSASLDHVRPGARGGSWSDHENLVSACWPCNSGKADLTLEEIGWNLLDEAEVQSDWDGLGPTGAVVGSRLGEGTTSRVPRIGHRVKSTDPAGA
jgi:5-methylcytosine-specific restriction endonuclease McrA